MKKKFPLSIFKEIQPILKSNLDVIYYDLPTVEGEDLILVKDNDPESDFYFGISKNTRESLTGNNVYYILSKKPKSKDEISTHSFETLLQNVGPHLEKWIATIREFNEAETIFDDPILKSYEEKFAERFKILDTDAETAPYELEIQLYLDEYLAASENKISGLIEDSTDEAEIKELEELRAAAVEVRRNISKLPKQAVMQRLGKFWAKAQKMGLPILKVIFMESVKELTKYLVKNGTDLLS